MYLLYYDVVNMRNSQNLKSIKKNFKKICMYQHSHNIYACHPVEVREGDSDCFISFSLIILFCNNIILLLYQ